MTLADSPALTQDRATAGSRPQRQPLAGRTALVSASETARMRTLGRELAAAGRRIANMAAGELDTPLAAPVRRAAIAAIEAGHNRYTDTSGLPDLRSAIAGLVAEKTGLAWTPAGISVTAGAKQALFNAAMTLIDPGCEVLIPCPYWTTFPTQIRIAGGRPVALDTTATGYLPTPAMIRAAITPATRMIVLNTPNNPTGRVYDAGLLDQIATIALDHDLWILFDECYGALVPAPAVHVNLLRLRPDLRDRVVLVDSFSKSCAMTGWRIGYLAAPEPVIKAASAFQSHTASNPNVIAQHAVLAALTTGRAELDAFQADIRTLLAANRALALDILAGLDRVPVRPGEGGFYLYLDLGRLIGRRFADGSPVTDADAVAERLLGEAGVASVPGGAFGDPRGLRLSYAIDGDDLATGLRALVATLNRIA